MSTLKPPSITQAPPRIVRAVNMPSDTLHVSVVIVGAGACGLTAAVRLRDAGIDCVLLERDSLSRGSTALSSGFIPAAGTRLQKSLGIDDSVERFAEDIQAKAHGDAAPHLVAAYSTGVAQAIDSL
jgi:fumarate reductase flavoprotein subunit